MLARQDLSTIGLPATPFGRLLRDYRFAAGLTQEQLAERAGLSVEAVSALERGSRTAPRPETLAMLADALRLPPVDRAHLSASVSRGRTAPSSQPVAGAGVPPISMPFSSFVGRQHEVAALHKLLAATRLLTLTGPGGIGKTRLALAVATEEQGRNQVAFDWWSWRR